MTEEVLIIDGSELEGGGQVLRVSCSIAAVKKMNIRIEKIRAKRANPGLAKQHVACIESIASICNINTAVKEKQKELDFNCTTSVVPTSAINKTIKVNSAGSCCLVFQSILPILTVVPGTHIIKIVGGTHVTWSPNADFYNDILSPVLLKFGINFTVEIKKYGFFPRGGGEIVCNYTTPEVLKPIDYQVRGKPLRIVGKVFDGKNNEEASEIIKEMKKRLRKDFKYEGEVIPSEFEFVPTTSKCKIIELCLECENCNLSAYFVEEKNESFEDLMDRCINHLSKEYEHGGCCDEYVQDQLLVLMALTKGKSTITCGEISLHSQTVIALMKKMLGLDYVITNKGSMNVIELDNH